MQIWTLGMQTDGDGTDASCSAAGCTPGTRHVPGAAPWHQPHGTNRALPAPAGCVRAAEDTRPGAKSCSEPGDLSQYLPIYKKLATSKQPK